MSEKNLIEEKNLSLKTPYIDKLKNIYKECRIVVFTFSGPQLEKVKESEGMTNEDVAHELYIRLVYDPCDERKCTRNYREHWIENESNLKAYTTHRNWIRVELRSMLKSLSYEKMKLSKEEYSSMFSTNEIESKLELEELFAKILIVAKSGMDFDLIKWKLGSVSAEYLMSKYDIKSRKTITNKWMVLKKRILEHKFEINWTEE